MNRKLEMFGLLMLGFCAGMLVFIGIFRLAPAWKTCRDALDAQNESRR